MRIGRLAKGPGNDFWGSGVGGSNVDGLSESCSLVMSRSRERS